MTMINIINEISVDCHNDHRRQEAATPTNTAMRMFQNKDRTGNELLDSSLPTTHQNQVGTDLKRRKCRSRYTYEQYLAMGIEANTRAFLLM